MARTPGSRDPREQEAKTPYPEQEQPQEFGRNTLIGKPAQPAELAPAYVFLASEDSSCVTASIMDLTGGRMLP